MTSIINRRMSLLDKWRSKMHFTGILARISASDSRLAWEFHDRTFEQRFLMRISRVMCVRVIEKTVGSIPRGAISLYLAAAILLRSS